MGANCLNVMTGFAIIEHLFSSEVADFSLLLVMQKPKITENTFHNLF